MNGKAPTSSAVNADWPVLRWYDARHLRAVALPVGGIGTGTVSVGGRGDLRDWELMNRPAKGYIPASNAAPFFAIRVQPAGAGPVCRALEGPLDPTQYEGSHGSATLNSGLPRFRDCSFHAAYPLGQFCLADPDVPAAVRGEVFNPLLPGDPEASGIPVAVLRYVVRNTTSKPLRIAICGSLPNFIGDDGSPQNSVPAAPSDGAKARRNRNRFRTGRKIVGILMDAPDLARRHPAGGTLALSTLSKSGVSYRTNWAQRAWGDSLLDFWDDFTADGKVDERTDKSAQPMASLCVQFQVPARAERAVTFLLSLHFPNRLTWTPDKKAGAGASGAPERIGNFYTEKYKDAWHVAESFAGQLRGLERKTVDFVKAFCACDLPEEIKEAALFNVSTLRTQTCFRTPDGRFYGWEGCSDHVGCCPGSCTHVWNYELTTPFLFGELAATMRDVEFAHATDARGLMSFRARLPLARAQESGRAAADGQMGCLLKLYREWQLSGDAALLGRLWPHARRALEFCWIAGGWDADRDGVMEGCQHNTMDVEYFGPNPQMAGWYLGALRAAEEMARAVGEQAFADQCRALFEKGRRWVDEQLFNGEYYEHLVMPLPSWKAVADGLNVGMGTRDPRRPELQLGAGCLIDQLVGQYMAQLCGLGYLLAPRHVRRTLRSVMRYNWRDGFHDHFNPMRSFALGDEAGLCMASYPRGNRPQHPFPYYGEVMTGFEYCVAVHMLYEGLGDEALRIVRAIRDRYDGMKRNPFDEAECGHHYARAMAAWGLVVAFTGFQWSAVEQHMMLAPNPGTWFWSTGYAWGTCSIARGEALRVTLKVCHGRIRVKQLTLRGAGAIILPRSRVVIKGRPLKLSVPRSG